ncbi:hypothetical protein BGX27_003036 [Mortierella sp. AM989]|nr:hypothetical protein BGX27_003036 [Mortierella sp. AM989]
MRSFLNTIVLVVMAAIALFTISTNAHQPQIFDGDIIASSGASGKFKDMDYNALRTLAQGPYPSSLDAVMSSPPIVASGSENSHLFKRQCNCPAGFGCCSSNAVRAMDTVAALEQPKLAVDPTVATMDALLMLRSRSSSPTSRRFASVLAYHPTPEGYSKQKAASGEQLFQEESEADNSRGDSDIDNSPSRIAFRNLEESWKRFELDSAASPPLTSNPTPGSTLSRPGSPLSRSVSPLPPSRLPYRELIECASRSSESKEVASVESNGLSVNEVETKNRDQPGQQGHTKSLTGSLTKSDPEESVSSSQSLSSKPTIAATAGSSTTRTAVNYPQHPPQPSNTFLTSNEARHILDLPSLLGRDPSMIPEVLAMPVPLQPTRSSTENVSSNSPIDANANTSTSDDGQTSSAASHSFSDMNTKAETAAQAMTKRYAAKNLNMTETEAHRMVQMMAAEIVALHEEREVMIQKMEQAKREMLGAARLLRMKATMAEASENSGKEMQDLSSENRVQQNHGSNDIFSETEMIRRQVREEKERDEEEDRQRQTASLYDRDEWKG